MSLPGQNPYDTNPPSSNPNPPPGNNTQPSNPGNTTKPQPQNPNPPGERPARGYTYLSRDPNRKERKEHTDGLKIRVNADLALDLNIKGEIYGDLIVGIITDDKKDDKN